MTWDDKKWEGLTGGYKNPYDPRPALRKLQAGDESVWDELWNELHHQGDIGEASYATVPQLVAIQEQSSTVNWNFYALISTIEIERHRRDNPPLPSWLVDSYRKAWDRVFNIAIRDLGRTNDPVAVAAMLGALALCKGQLKLGAFIAHSDFSEIEELLEERNSWSKLYGESASGKNPYSQGE
jgi:hypothetical protein